MKRTKKFFMLVPVLGLFLSGCSFKEVKHSIGESWIGQHILHPVYDPIRDLINGDKKKSKNLVIKHHQGKIHLPAAVNKAQFHLKTSFQELSQ